MQREDELELVRPDGRVRVELRGERGPWLVCVPGMGELRQSYRALAPQLLDAGYRVALMDLRGHGASDVGFADYSSRAVGEDLVALLDALDGPAVLLGNSMAAAASVWAAAERPERIAALVPVGPFARDVGSPWVGHLLTPVFAGPWGPALWIKFYRSLYPAAPPADLDAHCTKLQASLREAGRMAALRSMLRASKAECAARLPEVRCPSLVLMGERDPDFKDPAAEARWLQQQLGGQLAMIAQAGHYPHAEQLEATLAVLLPFLQQVHGAAAGA